MRRALIELNLVRKEISVREFKSIVDVFLARSSSDGLAYVFLANGTAESEVRWTFADAMKNSSAFAAHLSRQSIGVGDRVVLAVNPSLEYVGALYGIMQLGATPVPCFPPLRPKELERFHAITLDCSPKAIVIDEMFHERIEVLRGRLKSSGLQPVAIYTEDVTAASVQAGPVPRAPDDLALIQYTWGSTGSPNGVCLTHENLVSNCEALGRSMGVDPDRVGLSWLPPYHDMGLMGTILLSMYHGWPLVLMSPMHFIQRPRRWLQAITDYKVSITVGPNFSLDLCADELTDDETAGLDLSTVRQLRSLRILHDPADESVPISDSHEIAAAVSANLVEVAGPGHHGLVSSDDMRAALTACLRPAGDYGKR